MRIALLMALVAPLAAQEPRALFLEHCAACHGERGDGRGTTPLAKPARSFLDGGFSYGNTPTAIGRTIEHGIPGTPMPSFAEALDAGQREALVEYVISLGPPRKAVRLADTILEVRDRPRVVRGYLPALGEGVPEWPRGLLVGLTSGTTFQYRGDDLRLLAVRQGDFVQRRDWSGRGGNPLRPLGTVTHLVERGDPRPTWFMGGAPLRARLTRTAVRGEGVEVTYALQGDGQALAHVVETPRVVRTSAGAGFVRELAITCSGAAPLELDLRWGALVEEDRVLSSSRFDGGERAASSFYLSRVYRDGAGQVQLEAASGARPRGEERPDLDRGRLRLSLAPGELRVLRLYQVALVDAEAEARFREEVGR